MLGVVRQHELVEASDVLNVQLQTEIVERKRTEEALRRAQAQLADRAVQLEALVAERTAALRETVGELEAFSYSVAHDMRAPLRSMASFARLVQTEHSEQLDETGKELLGRVVASAQRLNHLVTDVLNYSSVTRQTKLTIHLVEDDGNDVFLMQRAFGKSSVPMQVQVARDGREGMRYLHGEGEYAENNLEATQALVELLGPYWLNKNRLPRSPFAEHVGRGASFAAMGAGSNTRQTDRMLRGAPISGSRVIALLFAAQALACGSDGDPSALAGTDSSGGSGGGDARVPDDVGAMPDADAAGDDAPFDAGVDDGAGFESLFNGLDLDGWQLVGVDTSTLSVENGAIKCTGQPQGYFYPAGTYRNFVWRVDFRFAPSVPIDANSGYFVYITGPHQIWPSALEVQGRNTDFGDVFQLPGLEPLNDNLDVAAMNAARRPLGEWNQIEITSNEGTLSVRLNGTLINVSPPVSTFREGQIALESEGAEVYFRNVVIKRLP